MITCVPCVAICARVQADLSICVCLRTVLGGVPREKSGYYSADAASAAKVPSDKKFVMVIPPPNVTGTAGAQESHHMNRDRGWSLGNDYPTTTQRFRAIWTPAVFPLSFLR